MKRLLITGANGMLGATLVRLFQEEYEVYATGSKESGFSFVQNYKSFDLRDGSYEELLEWSNPDAIIHCAALTNGNYCQKNPMEAFEVNGLSLKKFTDATKSRAKIIYISTDAVFSSQVSKATERDCPRPENIYGKSKELGEFFLLNSEADYTIVRTTIVGLNFNPSKVGFVEWIINSAVRNEEITLFDDVLFTPITIWDLAKELKNIISTGSDYSRKTLHIAGKETCTKYRFGVELLRKLNLPVQQVRKGSIKDMEERAKRSTDQTLNSGYYESVAKTRLPDLEKATETIKENLVHYEKY